MTTAIVLIPVDYLNSFELAKKIQGQTYKTTTALRIHLAMELSLGNGNKDAGHDIVIYNLEDFTQAMNMEEVNNEDTFMAYVNFE